MAAKKKSTTKKPNIAKRAGKGYLRLNAYGSTRYTSQGAKKSSRLKGAVSAHGGSLAGAAAGAALTKGKSSAAMNIGSTAGAAGGRAYARKKGYVRRTKKRMTVRAVNKARGKK